MRIFFLIENERTYQPRVYDTLAKELAGKVVGVGLVPFDPMKKGWEFWRFYFSFLGVRGLLYKTRQVLKQQFRGWTGLSRLGGPPASISELAKRYRLPLLKTANPNRREFREEVKKLDPDLILSNQGFLLKRDFLAIPRLGTLNRHAALLPRYRGIYPIFWALLHDEKEIGVTVHFMNEKYDEGKIIAQRKLEVKTEDTFFSLYNRVIELTPAIFLEAIGRIERKEIPEIPNSPEGGSYFSYPKDEDIRLFQARGKRMI